jgi:DNA-directed RNA polymerase specialized sigma24 family protein
MNEIQPATEPILITDEDRLAAGPTITPRLRSHLSDLEIDFYSGDTLRRDLTKRAYNLLGTRPADALVTPEDLASDAIARTLRYDVPADERRRLAFVCLLNLVRDAGRKATRRRDVFEFIAFRDDEDDEQRADRMEAAANKLGGEGGRLFTREWMDYLEFVLDARELRVISLRYELGLTLAAVAGALSIPVTSVQRIQETAEKRIAVAYNEAA